MEAYVVLNTRPSWSEHSTWRHPPGTGQRHGLNPQHGQTGGRAVLGTCEDTEDGGPVLESAFSQEEETLSGELNDG